MIDQSTISIKTRHGSSTTRSRTDGKWEKKSQTLRLLLDFLLNPGATLQSCACGSRVWLCRQEIQTPQSCPSPRRMASMTRNFLTITLALAPTRSIWRRLRLNGSVLGTPFYVTLQSFSMVLLPLMSSRAGLATVGWWLPLPAFVNFQVGTDWITRMLQNGTNFNSPCPWGYVQKHLFQTKELTDDGKYEIWLYQWWAKEWKLLVIDDFIACKPRRSWWETKASPRFAQLPDGQIYVNLLEKAGQSTVAISGN